jgi:predicted nucleic acid-binding protein
VIVLDTSVLIAHLDGGDAHHEKARDLLASTGAQPLGANPVTLAETLVSPARAGRLADAQTALRRLGVDELPIGAHAAARLAQLRAELGLKLPDCCVLAAAEEHAGKVASFDSALLEAARTLGLAAT